jgi:hypothetical protein
VSKTYRGEKGDGWDRIANSGKYATTPGKFQKKQNVAKERRSGKKILDCYLNMPHKFDE